ncbi:ISL3 family transposase [Coleofasciculus sp. E2-BRE-01]|uniref:ISL3 family transposase n=1 Tax=Coleofasciculus sp. E2-BRE-01 TaxID=3069524 RepID=UPI0032FBEF6B
MPSKPKNKLLSELLNLKGVKVKGYQNYQDIGIILVLSATQKQAICHRCQNKSNKLHQNHWYTIKDLPILDQPVYLTINRRQFKCQHCRIPFSEELDYVNKKRRYTKRLAQDIVQQVLADDIKTVAQKKAVSEEEIQTMLRDVGEELIKSKPNGLKKLGIDEIALIKGQGNYCAVLVDLEASKLVGILEGRTQDELRKTLQQWGKEVLIQIEEVSIDLWKPYKNLVEELMPNAQVVADRFHVMKQVNEELDRQRKKERNAAEKLKESAEKEKLLSGLKKSKYVLLKNEKNLNNKGQEKLKQVKEVSPVLSQMHKGKEELRKIFDGEENWGMGLLKLGDWLLSFYKYFPNSKKTIIRWIGEIISYFDQRTTQGVVEGINNKIKLIKRSGYGFRNFDNFKLRCLLCWRY